MDLAGPRAKGRYGVTGRPLCGTRSSARPVEALDGPPDPDSAADLTRDGQLEVPGGVLSIPKSDDETFQVGVELPGEMDALEEALAAVERHRIMLWPVSAEPCWDDEDDWHPGLGRQPASYLLPAQADHRTAYGPSSPTSVECGPI